MANRKAFLLRIDRDVLDALQRWADDDLRSLNGQIEFVLRRTLKDVGRAIVRRPDDPHVPGQDDAGSGSRGGDEA